LGNSLNIPAVKAIQTIGVEKLIERAARMGITGWQDPSQYGPSLALGGGEIRMVDMAQAFGALANQGVKVPLAPILKVESFRGELLKSVDLDKRVTDLEDLLEDPLAGGKGELERVLDAAPAYLVSHIMQDNSARTLAFGANSSLVIPDQVVSVKTGTTNDLKDNWTIGFTPEFLSVVWVGNNDNTPMSYLASGITGAAPIFNDIMSYVLQNQESSWQSKPADVMQGTVCPSGMPSDLTGNFINEDGTETESGCTETNEEFYWLESLPSRSSIITKEVWIKPETGLPPAFGEEAEGLVLETHTIYQDPVTPLYCGDCTRAVNEETGEIIYEKHYAQEISYSPGNSGLAGRSGRGQNKRN
jgi:membrane peptidoglycan carboxypeptidase